MHLTYCDGLAWHPSKESKVYFTFIVLEYIRFHSKLLKPLNNSNKDELMGIVVSNLYWYFILLTYLLSISNLIRGKRADQSFGHTSNLRMFFGRVFFLSWAGRVRQKTFGSRFRQIPTYGLYYYNFYGHFSGVFSSFERIWCEPVFEKGLHFTSNLHWTF